jgi:hypothetical protein
MHTISFFSLPVMKVDIYNQCPDFKLTDQKCFSCGTGWNRCSSREVKADSMMSVEFKSSLEAFGGVVMYELQRKYVESTRIQLLVAWESEDYKTFCVYVRLLECNELLVWNETRLKEYYQRYVGQLHTYTDPIKDTWLMHDGTVLMTRLELTLVKRDGRINVTISEGIKDDYTKVPTWIGPKRCVLLKTF